MAVIHEDITSDILASAIEVHHVLGPGLLESSYETCLAHELVARGRRVARQVALPLVYKDQRLDCGYRIDLLVDDAVIVELKVVDKVDPIHEARLLMYLRLGGYRVGLILNFNKLRMADGIVRRVL